MDAMTSRQTTVLVVDDNPLDREHIVGLLGDAYRVIEAHTAAEGIRLCRTANPDCVLLGHYLPDAEGLECIAHYGRLRTVVIVMTGQSNQQLAMQTIKNGARDYIVKSAINSYALDRVIRREIERFRLELDLRSMQERFDEVASRIDEVLWVRSLEGEFLYLSPSFERVWQRARAGLTVEDWEQTMHPDDRGMAAELSRRVMQGHDFEAEHRIVRANGEVRRILNRAYPICDDDGVVIRVGGIARDITEASRLQEELRIAQKLEAIGQLAAGIAHEINTPAQYVADNLTFFQEAFDDLQPLLRALKEKLGTQGGALEPEDVAELAELAERADIDYLLEELPGAFQHAGAGIHQIRKIVLAMKDFSFPGEDLDRVDLNKAIATTMTICRNEWKYHAEIETDLDPSLPEVMCVPAAINQVILNIVVNAAHAVADANEALGRSRGTITIRSRRVGGECQIEFEDSGTGIPDAVRERIFDPFFTTKKAGKGTGQGLAICHRIVVDGHGGTIRVDSKVGHGTTFTVRLPIDGVALKSGRAA
jgi:two-component system, NtrC family, sensor kinase